MFDYDIFYKSEVPLLGPITGAPAWDTFISAFTSADRSAAIYDRVQAGKKVWLVFPEYDYAASEVQGANYFRHGARNEAEFILRFADWCVESGVKLDGTLAIDITGFIRPYLLFLVYQLAKRGVRKFDALYAEPDFYKQRGETRFSNEVVREVRQVSGYEGVHATDISKDVLIINSGYDDHLISQVASNKDHANKIQLFGFPSLRPDMYQENRLRADQAQEAVGAQGMDRKTMIFAPAYDPFVTASELSRRVDLLERQGRLSNLYLSPIGTKPQVLGFSLFYLRECQGKARSIIYPFCDSYSKETATGVSRIWKYTVEL